MSMRLGTSMTFRTRPRCLRMRKLDWTTLAIAAPDVSWPFPRRYEPRACGLSTRHGEFLHGAPGTRSCPARCLLAAVDLSRKFDRVKQKARRRGGRSVLGGQDSANSP